MRILRDKTQVKIANNLENNPFYTEIESLTTWKSLASFIVY